MVTFKNIRELEKYLRETCNWQFKNYYLIAPNKSIRFDQGSLLFAHNDGYHLTHLFNDGVSYKRAKSIELDEENSIILIDKIYAFKYA